MGRGFLEGENTNHAIIGCCMLRHTTLPLLDNNLVENKILKIATLGEHHLFLIVAAACSADTEKIE